MRRDSDRLEASNLLAERGWGKAAAFAEVEAADPLGLEGAYEAAEEFRRKSGFLFSSTQHPMLRRILGLSRRLRVNGAPP